MTRCLVRGITNDRQKRWGVDWRQVALCVPIEATSVGVAGRHLPVAGRGGGADDELARWDCGVQRWRQLERRRSRVWGHGDLLQRGVRQRHRFWRRWS